MPGVDVTSRRLANGASLSRREVICGLLLLPASPAASAETTIRPLSSADEIIDGDPPEGLYRNGGNLIVVARYDADHATASMMQDRVLMLMRVTTLMRDYVTQRGLPGTHGRYGRVLLQFAGSDREIVRYPGASRQLRREQGNSQGMLAIEFLDGVALIEQARANFEAVDLVELTRRFKRKILAAGNPDLLAMFALENGEIIQAIISAAELFEKTQIYTAIPTSGNQCAGDYCAMSSDLHLQEARAELSTAPAKALLHLMLARLGGTAEVRNAATALLADTLPLAQARDEFLAVIGDCDRVVPVSGMDLVNRILRNGGIQWPSGPERVAASKETGQPGAQPQSASDSTPEARLGALLATLDDTPLNAKGWATAGRMFRSGGGFSEAIACFHQVLLQSPQSLRARLDLADAYADLQARTLAGALYRDVLDRAAVADASLDNTTVAATAQRRLDTL